MNFDNQYLAMAQVEPVTETVETPLNVIYHSNILNFMLVIFFLVWISRKTQVFSAISEKRNAIIQRIKNAELEKISAEAELEETKKQVANSEQEVHSIVKEAGEIAESLSARIRKEAGIESEELHKKAERIVEAEKEMAANEVMQDISRAAFVVAEEHIKQAIDERLHKKYIDEFIDNLDNLKV